MGFLLLSMLLIVPTFGAGIRSERAGSMTQQVVMNFDGNPLHPLHHDHPHYQKLHDLDPQHAMMFKRLASQSRRISNTESVAVNSIFSMEPCGTGMEINSETGEPLSSKCIDDVFASVQQDKLPGTALLGDFIAQKFYTMSKEEKPWVERFAFVIAAATAITRQFMQPGFMDKFSTAYDKQIVPNAFRPTSVYTLRYKKTTLFSIFFMEYVREIAEFIAAPCQLIPDVGLAFIASIQFPLSSWCKYAVTGVVTKLTKQIEPMLAEAIVKMTEQAEKDREGQGQKNTMRCFNLKTISSIMVKRIDQFFTKFNGDECDFFKPLDPTDPDSTLFSKTGLKDPALLKKFEECKTGHTAVNSVKKKEGPKPDKKADEEAGKEVSKADDVKKKEGTRSWQTGIRKQILLNRVVPKPDKKADEEAGKEVSKADDDDKKNELALKIPEPKNPDQFDCSWVVNRFLATQLPPHIKNSEIVKYALLTMLDNVFNFLESKVQQAVKKFVHFVNVASGATESVKAGMCCSKTEAVTIKKATRCCDVHTMPQCNERPACAWYEITPGDTEYAAVLAAYPKKAPENGKPAPPEPKPYGIQCPAKIGDKAIRTTGAGACPKINVWTRLSMANGANGISNKNNKIRKQYKNAEKKGAAATDEEKRVKAAWDNQMKANGKDPAKNKPRKLPNGCFYICQQSTWSRTSNENCARLTLYTYGPEGTCENDQNMLRAHNACLDPMITGDGKACVRKSNWICSASKKEVVPNKFKIPIFPAIKWGGGTKIPCVRFTPGMNKSDKSADQKQGVFPAKQFFTVPDPSKGKEQPLKPVVGPTALADIIVEARKHKLAGL